MNDVGFNIAIAVIPASWAESCLPLFGEAGI
jgi:hypothetical protein